MISGVGDEKDTLGGRRRVGAVRWDEAQQAIWDCRPECKDERNVYSVLQNAVKRHLSHQESPSR